MEIKNRTIGFLILLVLIGGMMIWLMILPLLGFSMIMVALVIPKFMGEKGIKKKEPSKRKEKEMLPVPTRSSLPVLRSSSYPSLYTPPPPESPVTTLARESPELAHDLLLKRSLDETHAKITGGPAQEFARQGRGMVAETTRRSGGLFSDPSVKTVIRPL